jgi:hypothetical protein
MLGNRAVSVEQGDQPAQGLRMFAPLQVLNYFYMGDTQLFDCKELVAVVTG